MIPDTDRDSIFVMKPKRVLTIELEKGEDVLNIIRETGLVILPRIALAIIFFIILFFFLFTFLALGILGVIAFAVLCATGLCFVCGRFLKWYMNAFIVTSERIIDLEQKSWLNKHISEIKLKKIDNVSHHQKGVFQTLFKCGDVYVYSRGGMVGLKMQNVRKPGKIQEFLFKLIEAASEK